LNLFIVVSLYTVKVKSFLIGRLVFDQRITQLRNLAGVVTIFNKSSPGQ